jgi:hypothetical protein
MSSSWHPLQLQQIHVTSLYRLASLCTMVHRLAGQACSMHCTVEERWCAPVTAVACCAHSVCTHVEL